MNPPTPHELTDGDGDPTSASNGVNDLGNILLAGIHHLLLVLDTCRNLMSRLEKLHWGRRKRKPIRLRFRERDQQVTVYEEDGETPHSDIKLNRHRELHRGMQTNQGTQRR